MGEVVRIPSLDERELRAAAKVLIEELGATTGSQIEDFIHGLPTMAPEATDRLRDVISEISRQRCG